MADNATGLNLEVPLDMLAAQRRESILRDVAVRGALRVTDLAASLGVSEVTIRRDIDELAHRGLVVKVHGGVTGLNFSSTKEPSFSSTSQRELRAKRAIASRGRMLVQPGHAIALMGGSTVFELATQLRDVPELTVVTNSLPVFELWSGDAARRDRTVVLAGGQRTPSNSLVGTLAEAAFTTFNFDLVFIGAHGIDPQGGLSSPNMREAEVNRLVIAQAATSVVLVDHTKWKVRGFSPFASLSDIDVVITDDGLDTSAQRALRGTVSSLVVASAEEEVIS